MSQEENDVVKRVMHCINLESRAIKTVRSKQQVELGIWPLTTWSKRVLLFCTKAEHAQGVGLEAVKKAVHRAIEEGYLEAVEITSVRGNLQTCYKVIKQYEEQLA